MYSTGEKPQVGDRVRLRKGATRAMRARPVGDPGTVEKLGATLVDPMPYIVFLEWDIKLEYNDADVMCSDLELVSRKA